MGICGIERGGLENGFLSAESEDVANEDLKSILIKPKVSGEGDDYRRP